MFPAIDIFRRGVFIWMILLSLGTTYKFDQPTTYYVDKDSIGGRCSDTDNSGTSITEPFCTFSKAHSVVQPGDTVYFRRAIYPYMIITKSGDATHYLTFASYPGETAMVDGTGAEATIYLNQTRYVEINGFEVIHASVAWFAGIHIRGNPITGTDYTATLSSNNRILNNIVHDNIHDTLPIDGISALNSSYNLIQGNTVYDNYYTGIGVDAQADVPVIGNQILNNVAYNNTGFPNDEGNADGIHISGNKNTANLIAGNTVYGNGDDGIDTWNSSGNTIEKNLVHDQRGGGDGNGLKAGGSTTGGNDIVRYNISYHNKSNGFDSNGSGGNTYYNNIAFGNGIYGFEDGWRTPGAAGCDPETPRCYGTFMNNIGMNNGSANISAGIMTRTSDYNIWYSASSRNLAKVSYDYGMFNLLANYRYASKMTLDKNSSSVNPLFVDTSIPDFHLKCSAPALKAGIRVDSMTDGLRDFDGIAVPHDTAPSIGAYENTAMPCLVQP